MESIYILQKTYENLYVLTKPVAAFLEKNLPCVSGNWKYYCIDDVLKVELKDGREKFVDKKLSELDVYYLLKVLLDDRNWNVLKELEPENLFYSDENKSLLWDVREIRNKVAHPRIGGYNEKDFYDWNEKIKAVAKLFGTELRQLIAELHKSEKDKLFNFIDERTFQITMNSPHFKDLPQSKQESINRTRERLYAQTTAAGIMALFEDSYFINRGKPIQKSLDEYNLPTFESIMDKVIDFYYFGKEDK
ncbi:MAG TPA: hypothetical protein DCF70_07600 [Treponema sp.]|nr:hypothetical protein [Treponema sp.]